MELIRAQLETTTGQDKPFMTYAGTGRVGEGVSGKIFQHYGFRSVPPKDTDLVTIQNGNNNYSVAENSTSEEFDGMEEKDVVLYSDSGVRVALHDSDQELNMGISETGGTTNYGISISKSSKKILIKASNTIEGEIVLEVGIGSKVTITTPDSFKTPQNLVTAAYTTVLNAWFAANAAQLATIGVTPFTPPTNGTTTVLEAE